MPSNEGLLRMFREMSIKEEYARELDDLSTRFKHPLL